MKNPVREKKGFFSSSFFFFFSFFLCMYMRELANVLPFFRVKNNLLLFVIQADLHCVHYMTSVYHVSFLLSYKPLQEKMQD